MGQYALEKDSLVASSLALKRTGRICHTDPALVFIYGAFWYTGTMNTQPKNPLHGVTLLMILETLEAEYGFEKLGQSVNIKCFTENPSVKSSLTFLRKTPWARTKVEELYIKLQAKRARSTARTEKVL